MRTGMPPVMRAQMHQQMYPNAYQQYIQEQGRAINGFVLVVQFYSFLNCQEIFDRSLIFVLMNPDFDLVSDGQYQYRNNMYDPANYDNMHRIGGGRLKD